MPGGRAAESAAGDVRAARRSVPDAAAAGADDEAAGPRHGGNGVQRRWQHQDHPRPPPSTSFLFVPQA